MAKGRKNHKSQGKARRAPPVRKPRTVTELAARRDKLIDECERWYVRLKRAFGQVDARKTEIIRLNRAIRDRPSLGPAEGD
jgi:hypothetical protein